MTDAHKNAPDRRSQLDLLQAQLDGMAAWQATVRAREQAQESARLSREMRMDAQRRLQALRRANRALLARADDTMRGGRELLTDRPRVVVAHRNAWLRNKVNVHLTDLGLSVVALLEDGADAIGTAIAEQPDLLLVEDALPSMSGLEVVTEARTYAPSTVLAAQVADAAAVPVLLDAGAAAAYTRQVPPADIAEGLAALLARV